mmetsp:Transcript_1637/g.3267  ORF Transcript_1637/g.3267 Transcript_1637/m.3267 type:complete len:512 (-) Transcript_1637:23-1558(-)
MSSRSGSNVATPRDRAAAGTPDHFQLLGQAMRRLGEEVHAIEGRQAALGRRLVEIDGQLQGITEEQDLQSGRLTQLGSRLTSQEKGQKAVALGLQRSLSTTMAIQQEQSSYAARLDELSASCGAGAVGGAAETRVRQLSADWAQCFEEQERRLSELTASQQRDGQRLAALSDTVAAQAKSAVQLEDAVSVQRLDEQEHRLAALSDAVAVLALEVTKADTEALAAHGTLRECHNRGDEGACATDVAHLAKQLNEQAEAFSDLQEHLRDLQVALSSSQPRGSQRKEAAEAEVTGVSEPEPEGWAGGDAARHNPSCQDWTVVAQNLEAQVGCSLAEVRRRMDEFQELIDERVLVQLWQVGQQLPETLGRLDRLAGQCQECLSKAEAHEVRLDLTRASFETQEQRLQALTLRVERFHATEPVSARRGGCGGCSPGEAALASVEALTGRVEQQARALEELREQLQIRLHCSKASREHTPLQSPSAADDRGPQRDFTGLAELAELAAMAGKLGEELR